MSDGGVHGATADFCERLREALKEPINRGDVNVGFDAETSACDIAGDEFTLHLELQPESVSWIALDDEPSTSAERVATLEFVVGATIIEAIRSLGDDFVPTLAGALRNTNDPLSIDFAALLE